MVIQLRPYQGAAVDRARALLRQGRRRILIVAPTGAGKTVIGAAIIQSAHARSRRVVFFAHRRELIHQTRRKLLDAGIPPDQIGILMAADPLTDVRAPIQIASIDTWRHRDPPPADLVLIDEAHRSLSPSYAAAAKHYLDLGAVIVGLTATPYRADGGGLGVLYDELVLVATPRQLIADGYLVEPRVFSAPPDARPDLSGVHVRRGDYVEHELAAAMNTGRLVGGIVDHWLRYADGRRTVAFGVLVEHSRAITAAFAMRGIPAEHLDGETPTAERDAILGRLDRGETLIVANCGVLCEGWDQPSVKCAILARPTKSCGLYLQQAGRILRPWEGVGAIILDHAGNALVHGLPQDDREFALDKTPKKKARANTKECPECGAVLAQGATRCPECGYEFERAEQQQIEVDGDGDLVEIDPAQEAALRLSWQELCDAWRTRNVRRIADGLRPHKPGSVYYRFVDLHRRPPPPGCKPPPEIASTEDKRLALQELQQQARERGYKIGWAYHRFEQRFGHSHREVL